MVTVAGPAAACPPPVPGQTESQQLKPAFDDATDIVYGVVLKGARDGQKARFEVIHVYKGMLTAGQVIEAVPTYGFDPPALPWHGLNAIPSQRFEGHIRGGRVQASVASLKLRGPKNLEACLRGRLDT